MADERDPLVSRRYRELGSEEPPAELDERILARSRRRRSFQWHGPVAAAAVIVLAVAVTVHVEREERTPESFPAQAKPYEEQKQERLYAPDPPGAQKAEPPAKAAPAPAAPRASASREEARSRRDAARSEPAPQAPPPAAQESPPAQPALEAQQAAPAGAAADSAPKPMAAPGSRLGKLAEQSPEQWLEGIVELRAQGRHEEADERLKRFRERYPGYRIPEELKAKIERN